MSILDQHAAQRRDFRHDHGTDEVPPSRGKRNRKVCKKSPSREHDYAPKELHGIRGFWWDVCTHCGKHK